MKMKPWMKATIAVALVLLLAYGAFSFTMGSANPKEWSFVGTNGPEPTYPPGEQLGSQQIDMKDRGYNTLDSSASLTDATNFQIDYFRASGSGYMKLGTASAGTVTIETQPSDGGYIYASVEPRSAQAYYIDAKTTKANNPRIVTSDFFDIDNDGYKEFVFKVNVAGLEKPIGANAQCWIYPYLMAYLTQVVSTPFDISTIGQAATVKYIEWYTTFASTAKAVAITKVEFVLNTTDATKVSLDNLNIPGVGFLTSDQMGAPDKGATDLTWTWTVSPLNLNGANYVTLGTNQLNKFEFTTKLTCTLANSDNLTATINIYTIDQTGAAAALITDTVGLAE